MSCEQRRQEREEKGSAVAGAGSGRGQHMQRCCTNNWKLFFILLGVYFLFLYFLSTGRLGGWALHGSVCVLCAGGVKYLGLLSAP